MCVCVFVFVVCVCVCDMFVCARVCFFCRLCSQVVIRGRTLKIFISSSPKQKLRGRHSTMKQLRSCSVAGHATYFSWWRRASRTHVQNTYDFRQEVGSLLADLLTWQILQIPTSYESSTSTKAQILHSWEFY